MKLIDPKFTQLKIPDNDNRLIDVIRVSYSLEGQGRFEEDIPLSQFSDAEVESRIKAKHDNIASSKAKLENLDL